MKIPLHLAEEIGCHYTHLVHINRGAKRPSPALTKRILKALRRQGMKITLAHLRELRPDLADIVEEFCKG